MLAMRSFMMLMPVAGLPSAAFSATISSNAWLYLAAPIVGALIAVIVHKGLARFSQQPGMAPRPLRAWPSEPPSSLERRPRETRRMAVADLHSAIRRCSNDAEDARFIASLEAKYKKAADMNGIGASPWRLCLQFA